MSSEPDYNFNQPASAQSEGLSLLLPFTLLSAAIAIILVAQTVNVFKQRTSLRDGKAQYADAYTKRTALVSQSREIQKKLEDIVKDLLVLAMTDEEAKKIVSKYNIQQTAPTSGSDATPAPAPAPAPK